MKVRRDLKLLQLAKLEEVLEASFLVINGNKPKQKVQFLESLKRKRCKDDKYNFLERLLGVARLLSQMVEPILKAAIEISTLLAQSYFMRFSLTTLAVLARIRILVQQMLLDAVFLYNTVSSLSLQEQSIKLNQEGFEVFREYYPRKEEHSVKLEFIWQTDKYVLVEITDKNESKRKEKDDEYELPEPSKIRYENIEAFLGVDESEAIDVDHVLTDPSSIKKDFVFDGEKMAQVSSNNSGPSSSNVVYPEEVAKNISELLSENCGQSLIEAGSYDAELSDYDSFSQTGGTSYLLNPGRDKNEEKWKSVAFISVKAPTPSTTNQLQSLSGKENGRDSKVDSFFQMLIGGNDTS